MAQKETADSSTKDIIVRSLKQPNCVSAKEKDNTIVIDIEKELGVEIVGDTKVKIAIEEDEWKHIQDIMMASGELDEYVSFDKLIYNEYFDEFR